MAEVSTIQTKGQPLTSISPARRQLRLPRRRTLGLVAYRRCPWRFAGHRRRWRHGVVNHRSWRRGSANDPSVSSPAQRRHELKVTYLACFFRARCRFVDLWLSCYVGSTCTCCGHRGAPSRVRRRVWMTRGGRAGAAEVSTMQKQKNGKAAHDDVVRQRPRTPPAAPNTVPRRVVARGASQGVGLCRWRWSPIQHRGG
jgi:hypothetical protein